MSAARAAKPLLFRYIGCVFLVPIAFLVFGIIAIVWGAQGETNMELSGQTLPTTYVGVVAVFCWGSARGVLGRPIILRI
jgi:hypothetical protein